ncbi:TraR/DksA family transcriptional regulator [Actinomadura latina]|uniref:TraR/DksA family transcriptional regulator n=1 Tax=Actinomadura latina TaxID=163603 RepID=A0A846ZAI1_9ACTN|nr:TraR/DksA family transcriptional regulator [Actinomadura latina]
MLPALPVEAISAREADMAGATKDTLPAGKPAAGKPPAGKPASKTRGKTPAAKTPAKPGGRAGRAGGKAARAAELPVREGEHRWTAAELAEVRAGLQEQIEGLRAEIAASASQIAEGDASDGAGDDQADAGAKTYEREHELSLAYNSRDLLAQIERAVQRMDAGTYGTCESCARPIGKARLQVFPRATLCVTCKQREERR